MKDFNFLNWTPPTPLIFFSVVSGHTCLLFNFEKSSVVYFCEKIPDLGTSSHFSAEARPDRGKKKSKNQKFDEQNCGLAYFLG